MKLNTLVQMVFATYIEQEPYVRDLSSSGVPIDFKTVLELLTRYSVRVLSYIHPAIHPYLRF